jgi:hypothetical protein
VRDRVLGGSLSVLRALDGPATFEFPDRSLLGEGFTLIAPDALYHAREGKFYAIGPTLRPTLSKPLVPVPPDQDTGYANEPFWPYHIVPQR